MQRFLYSLVLIAVAALGFTSCSVERQLAREYVKKHVGEGIMVSPTDFLYKEHPGATIDLRKYPEASQQDSVAFYSSQFVQFVSDSIFLSNFTNAFLEKLEQYGYYIVLDHSADRFLNSKKPTWIVQLAQLQLEENGKNAYTFGYDDDDAEYALEYTVKSVTLNSWLEVNRMNSSDPKQMLFLSGYIADDTSQNVSMDFYNGQFYFNNPNRLIDLDYIYEMATASGKKHAELIFDYFMNDYIRQHLPSGITHRKEMHYNWRFNTIDSQVNEKFEVVN